MKHITKININRLLSTILSIAMIGASISVPIPVYAAENLSVTEWNFNYDVADNVNEIEQISDHVYKWTCPANGIYELEAWGASGGGATSNSRKGYGGYTAGEIKLLQNDTLYIYLGEHGNIDLVENPATFNGGGLGKSGHTKHSDALCADPDDIEYIEYKTGSGGGASDFRLISGNWNDTNSLESRILVAGGGGGLVESHVDVPNEDQITYGNFLSSGNDILGKGTDSQLNQGDCGHFTAWYTAASGGGYYGGPCFWYGASDGYGGISYFSDKISDEHIEEGTHFGHGKATITYKETLKSTLILSTGEHGSYNGNTGDVEITCEYGTEIILEEAKRDGYKFRYWTDRKDISANPNRIMTGTSYVFGLEDNYYLAHYLFDGPINISESSENTIHVDAIDDGIPKYYVFYASMDDGLTYDKINVNGYSFDENEISKSYAYTGNGYYTYKVKATGTYQLTALGGRGGDAYAQSSIKCEHCNQRIYDKQGVGSNGGKIQANVHLQYGDTIYVYVGGAAGTGNAGYNGGGLGATTANRTVRKYNGCWDDCEHNLEAYFKSKTSGSAWDKYAKNTTWYAGSGGGGGATDFRLNGTSQGNRIVVAGGGGGGSAISSIYYVHCISTYNSANGSVNSTGGMTNSIGANYIVNNEGNARRIYGGGGGGWYGGSRIRPGTNGVNTNEFLQAKIISTQDVVNAGNGSATLQFLDTDCKITALDADFKINPNDIWAPDAPEKRILKRASDTEMSIGWNNCKDNGGTFLYKLEAYEDSANSNELLYESNVLEMDGCSGTKGYYYYVDQKETACDIKTELDIINANAPGGTTSAYQNVFNFTESANFIMERQDEVYYVHVATVDNSGNVSETVTFEIPLSSFLEYSTNDEYCNKYGGANIATEGEIVTQELIPGTSVFVKENKTINEDIELTKKGFIFIGWNTKPDGTGDTIAPGTEITYDYILEKYGTIMTLYAQWKPEIYQINFNTNLDYLYHYGTSTSNPSVIVRKPQNVPAYNESIDFTRINKHTGQDMTGISGYWGTNGIEYTYENLNDIDNLELDYGGSLPTTSITGFTFLGWNTKPDGTGIFLTSNPNGELITFTNVVDNTTYNIDVKNTTFDSIVESLGKTKQEYDFTYQDIKDIPQIEVYAIWTNETFYQNFTYTTYEVSTVIKEADTNYYQSGNDDFSVLLTQYELIDENGNVVSVYSSIDDDTSGYNTITNRISNINMGELLTIPNDNGGWNLIRKTLFIESLSKPTNPSYWSKTASVSQILSSKSHGLYAIAQYLLPQKNNVSNYKLPTYEPFGPFYKDSYSGIDIDASSLIYLGMSHEDISGTIPMTKYSEYRTEIKENDEKILRTDLLKNYIQNNTDDIYHLKAAYPTGTVINTVDYMVQGEYYVIPEAATLNWARNNIKDCIENNVLNDPFNIRKVTYGYGGYSINDNISHIKLDKTAPTIEYFSVNQKTLDEFPVISNGLTKEALRTEMENIIKDNDFTTTFDVKVSDRKDDSIAAGSNDSISGIKEVLLYVWDVDNPITNHTYEMAQTSASGDTYNYNTTINLYKEFKGVNYLGYTIIVVDNAGNHTKLQTGSNYTGSQGITEDGYPIGDFSTDPMNTNPFNGGTAKGYLYNFSLKTVIYNENDVFNYDDQVYFAAGNNGHVEIWTIGYVENVKFNFLGYKLDGTFAPGIQSAEDIKNGKLDAIFNLGVDNINGYEAFKRNLSLHIVPIDTKIATKIDVTDMNDITKIVNGATAQYAFATYVNADMFGEDGTNIIIPEGSKVDIPEYWKYEIIGSTGIHNAITDNHYIIIEPLVDEVHYRTTHQTNNDYH